MCIFFNFYRHSQIYFRKDTLFDSKFNIISNGNCKGYLNNIIGDNIVYMKRKCKYVHFREMFTKYSYFDRYDTFP